MSGLVSGACFSEFGVTVTCVDKDAEKIAAAAAGRDADLRARPRRSRRRQLRAGRLAFTTDLAARGDGADAVFIAVGTPTRRGDGHADLTYVYAAAEEIARGAHAAMPSSSPNRRCRSAPAARSRASSARPIRAPTVDVASNPEFLREGSAIEDFMRPDRVVIGAESERARGGDAPALPAALSDRDADRLHQRSRPPS